MTASKPAEGRAARVSLPRLRTAGVLAAAAAALAVCAAPASATCGAPVLTGVTATVTCSPGTGQSVSVPAHVGGLTLTAGGGVGGTAFLSPFSGSGGVVRGTYVHAGPFTLTVDVGSNGADAFGINGGAGGAPGGGAGTDSPLFGGGGAGGGGYSRITDGATTLMTAAGGGGSGSSGQFGPGGAGGGGNAGSFTEDGQPGGLCAIPPCVAPAGGGASTTAPGAGESTTSVAGHVNGSSGSGSTGGDAGPVTGGGGGGGGCFGGGGGGTTLNGLGDGGGGGGGGSSCADASLTNVGHPSLSQTNGTVTVSYVVPTAAAVTSASGANFAFGIASAFTITSTGQPGATVSLDDPADLPPGLSFTAGPAGSNYGTISGTPTGALGSSVVTARATNGVGADDTQALTVHVGAASPAGITSTGPANFALGTAGSYSITGAGSPPPTISLDNPAALPAGLTFTAGSAGTGTATIAGTPTAAGSFTVTVRSHNGSGTDATQSLLVKVTAPAGTPSSGGGYLSLGGSGGHPPVTPSSTGVGVTLGCAGAAGTTCSGQVSVTIKERVRGGKILAVKAAKTKTKTVKVGTAKYTIKAGHLKVIKVKLNRTGRKLLKRFHKLKVKVTVAVTTANGLKQAASKKVTIKAKKKKH